MISQLRTFIARWDNENPLDRWFREKYKIAFNSPEHRRVSQLDILMEYLEDQMMSEYEDRLKLEAEKALLLEKGTWITDRSVKDDKDDDNLFSKIDVSQFNNTSEE
jgi:hypothetical protein